MKYTLVKFQKYVIGSSLVDIVKIENRRISRIWLWGKMGPAKLDVEIKSHWLLICFTFITKSHGLKSPFYKKPVRSKQTSLSSTQFHICTDYKKLRPLKLESSFRNPKKFRTFEPFKFSNARFFYPYKQWENFRTRYYFVRYRCKICNAKTFAFLRLKGLVVWESGLEPF